MDCPFCDILAKNTERLIKENESAFLILSNPRKVAGHFLVIPKRHVEKPWELASSELAAIFDLVFLTQKKVAETIATGCDVRQNYRPFLAQSRLKVDHIHYHVLPREFKDGIYERVEKHETDLFHPLPDEEFQKYKELFEN